jgi:2-dehydro-3-deoxyphosphogluconate aldolase / (4S)-4-hydroxy-2-oxoglutarate aldolase
VLQTQCWRPVLGGAEVDDVVATALACGVDAVELAMATPGVLGAVWRLADAGLVVGVGAIREADQVRQAVAAGATFVTSSHLPTGFVEAAHERGILAVPGALSPSEVAAALDAGAPAVAVFPGDLVPPSYLTTLRTAFGPVPLLVSGGVGSSPRDVRTWLDAGAWSVGVAEPLGTVAAVGAAEVRRRAGALSAAAWTTR